MCWVFVNVLCFIAYDVKIDDCCGALRCASKIEGISFMKYYIVKVQENILCCVF